MNRKELLCKLINMDDKIGYLNHELLNYGWDSKIDLVVLKRWHILQTLNKFINGLIKPEDVEIWAEAIECREDIGFEVQYKNLINEVIFELANSEIAGKLSETKAKLLIKKLIRPD